MLHITTAGTLPSCHSLHSCDPPRRSLLSSLVTHSLGSCCSQEAAPCVSIVVETIAGLRLLRLLYAAPHSAAAFCCFFLIRCWKITMMSHWAACKLMQLGAVLVQQRLGVVGAALRQKVILHVLRRGLKMGHFAHRNLATHFKYAAE